MLKYLVLAKFNNKSSFDDYKQWQLNMLTWRSLMPLDSARCVRELSTSPFNSCSHVPVCSLHSSVTVCVFFACEDGILYSFCGFDYSLWVSLIKSFIKNVVESSRLIYYFSTHVQMRCQLSLLCAQQQVLRRLFC